MAFLLDDFNHRVGFLKYKGMPSIMLSRIFLCRTLVESFPAFLFASLTHFSKKDSFCHRRPLGGSIYFIKAFLRGAIYNRPNYFLFVPQGYQSVSPDVFFNMQMMSFSLIVRIWILINSLSLNRNLSMQKRLGFVRREISGWSARTEWQSPLVYLEEEALPLINVIFECIFRLKALR